MLQAITHGRLNKLNAIDIDSIIRKRNRMVLVWNERRLSHFYCLWSQFVCWHEPIIGNFEMVLFKHKLNERLIMSHWLRIMAIKECFGFVVDENIYCISVYEATYDTKCMLKSWITSSCVNIFRLSLIYLYTYINRPLVDQCSSVKQ